MAAMANKWVVSSILLKSIREEASQLSRGNSIWRLGQKTKTITETVVEMILKVQSEDLKARTIEKTCQGLYSLVLRVMANSYISLWLCLYVFAFCWWNQSLWL